MLWLNKWATATRTCGDEGNVVVPKYPENIERFFLCVMHSLVRKGICPREISIWRRGQKGILKYSVWQVQQDIPRFQMDCRVNRRLSGRPKEVKQILKKLISLSKNILTSQKCFWTELSASPSSECFRLCSITRHFLSPLAPP